MSGMEIAIVAAVALGLITLLVLAVRALSKRHPGTRTRQATPRERAANQAEVEEWIARTKGDDHVKRMRGEH